MEGQWNRNIEDIPECETNVKMTAREFTLRWEKMEVTIAPSTTNTSS